MACHLKIITTITVLALLTSCAFLPVTYYEPQGEGIRDYRGCGGGPHDVLTLPLTSGVQSEVQAKLNVSDKTTDISIGFIIPETHSVRLASGIFLMVDLEKKILASLYADYTYHVEQDESAQYGIVSVKNPITDKMIGHTGQRFSIFGNYDMHKMFYVTFRDLKQLPDRFTVIYPELSVDGVLVEKVSGSFTKRQGLFAYVFNC